MGRWPMSLVRRWAGPPPASCTMRSRWNAPLYVVPCMQPPKPLHPSWDQCTCTALDRHDSGCSWFPLRAAAVSVKTHVAACTANHSLSVACVFYQTAWLWLTLLLNIFTRQPDDSRDLAWQSWQAFLVMHGVDWGNRNVWKWRGDSTHPFAAVTREKPLVGGAGRIVLERPRNSRILKPHPCSQRCPRLLDLRETIRTRCMHDLKWVITDVRQPYQPHKPLLLEANLVAATIPAAQSFKNISAGPTLWHAAKLSGQPGELRWWQAADACWHKV